MYEYWTNGERLYTTILPILAVIVLVIFIGLIFVFYYTAKGSRKRKTGVSIGLAVLISAGGYAYLQHSKYEHWIDQAGLINPGIRDRTVIMGSDVMEDVELVKSYRSMNLLEQLSALDMYERQETDQEIGNQYLGSQGNNHFFAIGEDNKYAFRYTGDVKFTDGPSRLSGASFELTDSRFEEIGFNPDSKNYLETFFINREEAGKASNKLPLTIIHPSEVFPDWNLGYQSTQGTSSSQ